jgi:hypothetical protein
MKNESYPMERFEKVSIIAEGPNAQPLRMEGKMPTPEFFSDEICRLSAKAMRGIPKTDLGWIDTLDTVVSCKQKAWESFGNNYRLVEYKDSNLLPNSPPIQIRLISVMPATTDEFGDYIYPTELKFYTPGTDTLKIIRFENLKDQDVKQTSGFRDTVYLENELNAVELTQKDLFFFYGALVWAADEKLPN